MISESHDSQIKLRSLNCEYLPLLVMEMKHNKNYCFRHEPISHFGINMQGGIISLTSNIAGVTKHQRTAQI